MPFYEYQCQACGEHHEAMQKMSDPPLRKCPHCGRAQLKRILSPPVFRLKGGGWYETDFKSDQETKRNLHADEAKADKADKAEKPEPAEKKDAAPAAGAESKAEAKAESKPAPPAKAKRSPGRSRKPPRRSARRR
jgi:putative FmdB family regulatory protein